MIKKFIHYYKPYKGLFALDMGAATIYSLLSILFPMLTRELLKTYIPEMNFKAMAITFAMMLAIYLTSFLMDYIRFRWGHVMGTMMETDMRSDLFSHLQKLSVTYFDTSKTGHIMSRMTNDLFQMAETAHHGPEDLILSVLTIVGAYAVMFSYSVPLSLISLIVMPPMLLWGIFMGRKMKSKNKDTRAMVAEVNATVENSIQGIREVKSFTSEPFQSEKFEQSNSRLKDKKSDQYKTMASYHSVVALLRNLYYFTTVVGGAILIYKNMIEAYDLVTFLLFVSVVLTPIDRMIQFVDQLQQGMASFERFEEIMEIQPSIKDAPDAVELDVTSGDIRYSEVSFGYSDKDGEVVGNVSMDIKGGSKVGIAGESGAGKTTIVSLLPRFYEIKSGKITIDGQDITSVTQRSLRQNIGIVQQNVFLFDDTIRENLRYGKSDASDSEIWDALEAADLAAFVRSLPDGLDTEVGERGTRLSGGQCQRISIARVFLKNPPILIFDEATSSLDSESEQQIQEAFNRLAKGRTSLVIAHRLTTIMDADQIFVMKKGRVVEQGTHKQLLSSNGQYAKLCRMQEIQSL
ncbi:MAG: ABC transporter ATP-binding protein [Sphaerochaetaceae bacterium]|jgi:ATP-binding cassette subfamily B protein|nr:ABC transporter ATP-binding protein [Sphaerochaetaceae bacterium]